MGGLGSGRPPGIKKLIGHSQPVIPPGQPRETMVLPNLSGDHSKGRVYTTPTTDYQLVNKKYVDDSGGVAAHAILDGSVHTDSVADAVTRGSLIYGNATPKWDELVVGAATTVLRTDGTDISWGNVLLDELDNPGGDKTFTMSNKSIEFRYTAPNDNAFEIEITGGFSGDGLHVHQHTGNPGATHLVHFEAEDADVLPLCVTHAGRDQMQLSHTSGSKFCSFKVDTNHDLTLDPSSTGKVIINSAFDVQGNITTTGTVDGIDIATDVAANTAASHAEAHTVASHSDTTGTGTELNTLTDNSMADTLHRHSELSASDGTPDAALQVDATGHVTISTDNSSADTAFVPMVLYNTDDTPPAASGFPIGTLYVQYTA